MRRFISVALALESPLPDVIRHPALRSPDFPHLCTVDGFCNPRQFKAAIICYSCHTIGNRSDKPGYVDTASFPTARMIIYLGLSLPTASSDLPESRPGKSIALCLVLLRMGFTYALLVTLEAVVFYTTFPPLPHIICGGLFLLH